MIIQIYINGAALPWLHVSQFVEILISRSMHQMTSLCKVGL